MQFYFLEVEETQQVNISGQKLRSHSYEWWKQLKIDKNQGGREKIQNWENMVIKINDKYMNF